MREKPSPSVRDTGDLFQRDAKQVISVINSNPLLNGVLAERVAVDVTVKSVRHSLGRVPKGFILVDSTADIRVWRSGSATATSLPLIANAAATVSLWIF